MAAVEPAEHQVVFLPCDVGCELLLELMASMPAKHGDRGGVEVDVAPLQAESFAAAQARGRKELPHRGQSIVADVCDEGPQVLGRPHAPLLAVRAGVSRGPRRCM